MKLTTSMASLFAMIVLMLSSPVFATAQDSTGFTALQGVEAQALSADEMQAVQGMISPTNIAELTMAITNDPNLKAGTKNALLSLWGKLAKLDGTRYEFLADSFFLLMKPRYPSICGLNADFCAQTPVLW